MARRANLWPFSRKSKRPSLSRGGYVVWPGPSYFRSVKSANRHAKYISSIDQGGEAYVGYKDDEEIVTHWREGRRVRANRQRNPIPSKWSKAKVRQTRDGKVQVMIVGKPVPKRRKR